MPMVMHRRGSTPKLPGNHRRVRHEIAYAKINLALHVRRRRDDGYHDLETLFAFLDDGDRLSIEPARQFMLEECGQFGGTAGPVESNLVTRAARLVGKGALPPLSIYLAKYLPVAAGLGGGSADAAAVLRLLGAGDQIELAASLGADVPACLASSPVIGTGTGTALSAVENDVVGLACILINPLVPLATGAVFANWDGIDRGPMPTGTAREIMLSGRNDLEGAAVGQCPVIADVLAVLHDTEPLVARMSGSGASCFAIYEDYDRAAEHEFQIREHLHQDWWTMLGRLR
jgi:4-diphosphocytidyl-2-C-methyl-D-erythritol kinase